MVRLRTWILVLLLPALAPRALAAGRSTRPGIPPLRLSDRDEARLRTGRPDTVRRPRKHQEEEDDEDADDQDPGREAAAPGLAVSGEQGDAAGEPEPEPEIEEPEDLRPERAVAVVAGADASAVGPLLVAGGAVRANLLFGKLALTLRAAHAYLWDGDDRLRPDYDGLRFGELDLSARGKWWLRKGWIELGAGGNLRAEASLAYGSLAGSYQVAPGLYLALGAGLNQVVDDTSGVRLLGARDRVSLGVSFDLTQREFANGVFDWHRYQGRGRAPISDGYVAYLEAGHRLRLADPGWNVRLAAYFEQNRLVPELPAGLAAQLADPATPVSDLVVPEFAMVGAATSLRRGLPGEVPVGDRRLRWFADAWLGYLWPRNEFGFDLQLGLGLSARGAGELAAAGFVSNSRQGGGAEGFSWGVGLKYVY